MTEAEPLSLVAVLNDADAGQKQKLTALATLAELASSDARRDEVFFAMQQIDKAFEQTLVDKEEGHKLYGTSLGRLHELMLCLLLRSTAYAFTSAQLLEFARGDLPLALSIVGALLRVPTYEDALVGCALGLLRGFFRPDTYTKFWLPGEQSIRAFPKRVETFSAELLRSKLLQAAVPPLAARLFGSGGDLRLAPLSQWPQPRAALAASFLRLVGETYLISWGCSRDQLRADLAAASSTVESLLLPLLRSAALEPVSAAPPPSLLRAALRAAVLCCFRAPPRVCAAVRTSRVCAALAPACLAPGRPQLAALLLGLVINSDALTPLEAVAEGDAPDAAEGGLELLLALQTASDGLGEHEVRGLLWALEGGVGGGLIYGGGGGRGRCGGGGGEALAELQSVPVARDAASTAELECVLQQRLVAAHPSAPHELREHLLRLEEQATQLEALQAEMEGLQLNTDLPDGSSPYLSQDLSSDDPSSAMAELQEGMAEGEAAAVALGEAIGLDLASALAPPATLAVAPEESFAADALLPASTLAAADADANADAANAEAADADADAAETDAAAAELALINAAAARAQRQSSRYRLLGELPELQSPAKGESRRKSAAVRARRLRRKERLGAAGENEDPEEAARVRAAALDALANAEMAQGDADLFDLLPRALM